ncbi:MAG: omptin family outer membrane protease [Treponema sp.]|nr:omptin family outer membrane protease [Candidatus Treponema scatequi]
MKKFLFLISFLFCFSVFAENGISKSIYKEDKKFFNFTIEPIFGTRIGHFGEQVYLKNSQTGEQYKLSELLYNFSPAAYTGADVDFKLKRLHVTFGTKYFIPMQTGIMSDSDWLQNANSPTGSTFVKTNYSEHENNLRFGLNLEAAIKYDFHPSSHITLSPVISFLYEKMIFSAMNGTTWYGNDINDKPASHTSYYSFDDIQHRTVSLLTGEVIQLRRQDYYIWLGLESSISSKDSRWDLFFGLYTSPFIYTHGEDDHCLRSLYYIDTTKSIFYAGKIKLYIQYNFTENISLKLSDTFLFTGNMQGNEVKSSSKSGPYQNQGTIIGATSIYCDIQLSGVFKF